MTRLTRAPLLCFAIVLLQIAAPASCRGAAGMGCYISVGDNDWLWTSPPVNSRASIESVFDSLHDVFGVDRIYWRGYQSEIVADHFVVRPENFTYQGFWSWERHLARDVGTSAMAVAAARKRDMGIWGMTALFDHGAQARVDSAKMGVPSPVEDKLRVAHPEWVAVDRAGLRRQAGPMELAYPELRRALVDRYVDLVVRRGYDGLMFYTYVEHCALRFEDEYGFNDPVVSAFKERYGQDIRVEPFDKHAWYRLRGEFVTQFLRELSAAFHGKGKKLGVAIDPQTPHFPAPWLCVRDVRPTGRIHMDWERWVREGIVDEIMVYCNGSLEAALNAAVAATRGTACAVSTIHSAAFPPKHGHLNAAGVRRVMVGAYEYIEWGPEGEQKPEVLDGDEFLPKLRLLRQVAEKKTPLPLDRIAAALRDENVLVRRQAVRALIALGDPAAVSALEAALADDETGVRCLAASALAKLNGAATVGKVLDALGKKGNHQFETAVVSCLANMPVEQTPAILKGCADPRLAVRRATVYALGRGVRRNEAAPHLLEALNDPDPQVRYCAAYSLNRFAFLPDLVPALIARVQDPHPSVRNRSALSLQSCVRSHSRWLSAAQHQALAALTDSFAACGKDSDRPDATWSFRPIGNALLALGPRGRDALQAFMDQRKDRRLADFAWRILHVPQTGWRYVQCTESEAVEGYKLHPKSTHWATAKATPKPSEPALVPYLAQNFDALDPYARGKVGDYFHDMGQWRGLGDARPSPMIQAKVKYGDTGHSLRLTRGSPGASHNAEGLRADYRLTTQRATVEFRVLRVSPQSSFAATWKDSGSGHWYVGVFVAPGGKVSVVNGSRTWAKTPGRVPHGSWQNVRIDIDGAGLRYAVSVGAEPMEREAKDVPFPAGQRFNILTFAPQPPEGAITYVDDVRVTVPNPAHAKAK